MQDTFYRRHNPQLACQEQPTINPKGRAHQVKLFGPQMLPDVSNGFRVDELQDVLWMEVQPSNLEIVSSTYARLCNHLVTCKNIVSTFTIGLSMV